MKQLFLLACVTLLLASCQIKTSSMNENQVNSIIQLNGTSYQINIQEPIDLSLAVKNDAGVGAWYIDQPKITHVEVDGYVGKVALGGSTNFNDVFFNPHSHGTHTECIGHITKEFYSVNDALNQTFYTAQLFTVNPESRGDDLVITAAMFNNINPDAQAVIIRTLPNPTDKKSKNYSNTNPPYLDAGVMLRFRESGIKHVLIDLPSVDKEKDNGALIAHKEFWDFDNKKRKNATITELIYVPDEVEDGMYILDLQVAPIENDAAPSRPIIYAIK